MVDRLIVRRCLVRRAAVWLAVGLFASGVLAQEVEDIPKPVGFPAGPFYLAPAITTGYEYNSNLFLNSQTLSPTPDNVVTMQPALQLTAPFHRSSFRFADTFQWQDYQKTPQELGKTSNDALGDLTLRFGSLDTLEFLAHRINGIAETLAFDPSGEATFRGNPYRYNTQSIKAAREVPGGRGYRLSIQHNKLNFQQAVDVSFFDYSGFDFEAAYLQPLSSNTRLSFGYVGSRYDHFDIRPGSDPSQVFRTEAGDVAYSQIEGQLGPRQPYLLRLGWESLSFTGNDAADFRGLVGQGGISAIIGGGTVINTTISRQPYRSFFGNNNYVLSDQVSTRIERPFPRGSRVGGLLSFSLNSYAEFEKVVPDDPNSEAIRRQDRTVLLQAYAILAIRESVYFRLTATKTRRYSNWPTVDYDAIVVFGGFTFGWM